MFNLKVLENKEVRKLSNQKYVERLDKILYNIFEEKKGISYVMHISKLHKEYGQLTPYPQISNIYNIEIIQRHNKFIQRDIIDNLFGMIVQIELSYFDFSKDSHTLKILNQIGFQQDFVIKMRIVGEYFMNIVSLIETGKHLSRNNKYTNTLKIIKDGNNFKKYALFICDLWYFSDKYRNNEVHNGSELINNLKSMSGFEYIESDEIFQFANQIKSIFNDLIKYLRKGELSISPMSFGNLDERFRRSYLIELSSGNIESINLIIYGLIKNKGNS